MRMKLSEDQVKLLYAKFSRIGLVKSANGEYEISGVSPEEIEAVLHPVPPQEKPMRTKTTEPYEDVFGGMSEMLRKMNSLAVSEALEKAQKGIESRASELIQDIEKKLAPLKKQADEVSQKLDTLASKADFENHRTELDRRFLEQAKTLDEEQKRSLDEVNKQFDKAKSALGEGILEIHKRLVGGETAKTDPENPIVEPLAKKK